MVNIEIKAGEMVTGQGCGLVVVDVTRGVLRPTGHHWVTLFHYPSRLRTGHCIWMVVRSQISLSRAYTSGWGLERLVLLLSWVLAPSRPIEGGLYMGIRRSKHRERVGAWSPSMDGDSVLLIGG
jgi:hypothetical protein